LEKQAFDEVIAELDTLSEESYNAISYKILFCKKMEVSSNIDQEITYSLYMFT